MSYDAGSTAFRSTDKSFQAELFNALDTREGGQSELRVFAAIAGAQDRLSSAEQGSLLGLTRALARDGDIDPREAATITQLLDAHTQDGASALERFWPFADHSFSRSPGNRLFAAVAGLLSGELGKTLNDLSFLGAADTLLDSVSGRGAWIGALSGALANADLSRLSAGERTQLLSTLAIATADGKLDWADAMVVLGQLERFTGARFPNGFPKAEPQTWSATQNGAGQAHIDLGNYTIDINEHNSEFTLTNKATGERSRIWGDPHFDTNGDGSTDVDFWGTMTLNLEDGTRITINTTPFAANPAETLSSQLLITRGDQSLVVDGLDQNQIGDLRITQGQNGQLLDSLYGNGLDVYENPNGEGWLVQDGLFMRELTQADADTTKGKPGTELSVLDSLFSFIDLAASSFLLGALTNSFLWTR